MTLLGAIQALNELRNDDDMPVYAKLCIADIINVMLNDVQEIKYGRWITVANGYSITCSECGGSWDNIYDYAYCPNCGAKMDEEN